MKEKVTIIGSGESGIGAAILATKKGFGVFLTDYGIISQENKKLLVSLNVDFEEGGHTVERICDADVVIKSPGIPDSANVIKEIDKRRIEIISEIEFAFRYIKPEAKIIAITGTNGKTTTTLLTYHILKSAGLNVALAGNVGISLAKQVAEQDYDYFVVEISSFQLDGIVKFKPDIAILLNITPDHLDRYENDFNHYIASKFRITENLTENESFIYCSDSIPVVEGLTKKRIEACLFAISSKDKVVSGAYVDGGHMIFKYDLNREHVKIPLSEIKLIGNHNMINSMAAVLTAIIVKISNEKILKGIRSFENAPHRLEFIKEINGVRYINDSKATNVDAVYYALEGIDAPIIWIAGGIDKGNDYDQVAELVKQKVKGIVCLGTDNKLLFNYFSPIVNKIKESGSISDAIGIANEWSQKGDVVLLSPACASFDLFKNYEDRGIQFKDCVKKLSSELQQKSLTTINDDLK